MPVWRFRKAVPAMRTWHDTATASSYATCHVQTTRKALEAGELHGTQRKPNGRWRIHHLCLDAWVAGLPCPPEAPCHQWKAARRSA